MNFPTPLRKPSAVFFDWDGTLIDGFDTIIGGYNKALSTFGLPLMSPEDAQTRIRRSSREVFPQIFGANAESAQKIYYDYVSEHHLSLIKSLSHSRELLEFLVRNQIPAGVVSNKQHAFLKKEIAHMGWMHLIQIYIGAGITKRDKPAPDQLLLAAADTGFSGREDELWYIGDTETNMEAAHAARFIPVFIKHGLGKNEELYPYPPALVTHDCKGVISCIQELL